MSLLERTFGGFLLLLAYTSVVMFYLALEVGSWRLMGQHRQPGVHREVWGWGVFCVFAVIVLLLWLTYLYALVLPIGS